MYRAGILLAALALAAPVPALADASVTSYTSATAESGGAAITAGSDASGFARASAQSETRVWSAGGTTTVRASSTIEEDGVVREASLERAVPPGASVTLTLGTSSASTTARAVPRALSASASSSAPRLFARPFLWAGTFFARLASRFGIWR
ncbi:MAG TPA: hypothetical protein VHC68_03250 [Candidatus Paceibacterota bacterium]|nr:hypothetical protein [Candidatus Paceibacterota bacterium]